MVNRISSEQKLEMLCVEIDAMSIPEPNSGCVIWLGPQTKTGRARMNAPGYSDTVRRVVFHRKNGRVRYGEHLVATCGTAWCISADHIKRRAR